MNRKTILILALVAFSPAHSRDKKDVERIAALEKQVAELRSDMNSLDGAARTSFQRVGVMIKDLVDLSEDFDARLTKIERAQRTSLQSGEREK